MRVVPALLRTFSTHNNLKNTQTKGLNYVIKQTADRLVNGGGWKKIEPPVTKHPLEKVVETLQQFSNRWRANTEEFVRTSLQPIGISCLEGYSKKVNQLNNCFENLANLAERNALQFTVSKQAACKTVVSKHPSEDGTVNLTLTENRPLRKGVTSVVRAMADIILPPRDTYTGMAKYTCCTFHQ